MPHLGFLTYSRYMHNLRLGIVRYFNALPLVEGLEAFSQMNLTSAVPSHIGSMLEQNEIDIGLVSLIDLATTKVPFAILPVGMIGCEGPTLTVRLFSKVPPADIRTLAVDTDSHTSVALARIILAKVHGINPDIVDFDAREGVANGQSDPWPEAVLLIGDKVVNASPPSIRYPHQIDLGQAWFDLTGLPFVYATWMCRLEDAHGSAMCEVAALLERQRLRNLARIDWLVSARADAHNWPHDLAREYLGHRLRYSFGERERQAIKRFFTETESLGIAGPVEIHEGCSAAPHAADIST